METSEAANPAEPDTRGTLSMHDALFQQLINWLTLGCIYSLLALGFSLLFGVLQVIHFSHGVAMVVASSPWRPCSLAAALGGSAPGCCLACLVAIAAVGGGLALPWTGW